MNDRNEIILKYPIVSHMQGMGYAFTRQGAEEVCKCPLHADNSPSFRVNVEKRLWFCDPCKKGGSIIDLVMALKGLTASEAILSLIGDKNHFQPAPSPAVRPKIVKIYQYHDETWKEVYQSLRLEPKSFRQRRMGDDGKWIWNMENVRRVPYNLPKVMKAKRIWIVEGEKDVDSLNALTFTATCNVGGAGKWLDAYSEFLKGKEIVLCGDNDEPGRKHIDQIMSTLAGKVKSVRKLTILEPHKDVSDFIEANKETAGDKLAAMVEEANEIFGGIDLPIYSMAEMEKQYCDFLKVSIDKSLDLKAWLPKLGSNIRPLVPGELVTILASTGAGKTACLQNIAAKIKLQTLLFEIELPGSLMFERFAGIANKMNGDTIYKSYNENKIVDVSSLGHVHVCPLANLDTDKIEELINKSSLKIGQMPAVVMIDYIGLLQEAGNSRYERMSKAAEKLKVIAKNTNTIIIVASQVHRKESDTGDVSLHDGKDSGSIENSSGLVLGVWKDRSDAEKMFIKILKNTKGRAGNVFPVWFRETLIISES